MVIAIVANDPDLLLTNRPRRSTSRVQAQMLGCLRRRASPRRGADHHPASGVVARFADRKNGLRQTGRRSAG